VYEILTANALSELREFVGAGVYALENWIDGKVDVRHSTNCLEAVVRHYTQLQQGTHPCKEMLKDWGRLHFVMLEKIEDLQYRMMAQSYYLNRYQEQGYKFYRFRPALTYRVKIDIEDFYAVVRLKNSNHDSFVVGVFKNMSDAETFVATYYAKKLPFPVYACNEDTKRFFAR
jgi:hypothetical protein